jgi:hypothetical protein
MIISEGGGFGASTVDTMSTSLTSRFFADGFESGDTSVWSAVLL